MQPPANPTTTMKNISFNRMLPVDKMMTKIPNNKEKTAPITIVQGTTFSGKNCRRTTKMIAKIAEIQKLLHNAS